MMHFLSHNRFRSAIPGIMVRVNRNPNRSPSPSPNPNPNPDPWNGGSPEWRAGTNPTNSSITLVRL